MTIAAAKRAARIRIRTQTAACRPEWGDDLARHLLAHAPPPAGAIVAGFWPLDGEIDIRRLLTGLHAAGHAVVLPETPPRGHPLIFRRWSPGAPMRPGRFGTSVPDGDILTPDWLLVPLVAFDRQGRRLGYGGGYYDRTLPLLPGAPRIGCAFAAQELDEVPSGPYDIRLDAVATERGVIVCPPRQGKGGEGKAE
jgi:5-formyltetrahydrofolate cyclo-ligase